MRKLIAVFTATFLCLSLSACLSQDPLGLNESSGSSNASGGGNSSSSDSAKDSRFYKVSVGTIAVNDLGSRVELYIDHSSWLDLWQDGIVDTEGDPFDNDRRMSITRADADSLLQTSSKSNPTNTHVYTSDRIRGGDPRSFSISDFSEYTTFTLVAKNIGFDTYGGAIVW